MIYLSPEIEALAKKKKENSLVKKENSCGIFQDYGKHEYTDSKVIQLNINNKH